MAFQGSANLAAMYAPASRAAVESELQKFLAILGEADPALVAEVACATVSNAMLANMHVWNVWLADNSDRDRIGCEATKFFAAQALATTIMASTALDTSVSYLSGLTRC